ncbi:16S rRNA processing protein RimM [Enterobacteriaceae endosymbiont of Donacia crassipes]|uniref:ribosome maturation factor RimM n=1 Tax=Enterobacteriaceae endosymbiont of Donacia crassipes TaxID=2675776 RepID=UPI001448CA45|nr:ribosome maturation factor RimM [Enterobacteriaceae endosymbiont of Donacia crassipes]QJC34679.1 16S rRNA processing protein RimM [Enterobacteriaceae endosymbiont of Donacia crassipes]
MTILKKKIILGQFSQTYGIKGWIKLYSYTQNKKNIFLYKKIFIINNIKDICFIKFYKYKVYKKNYIVKFKNLNNINDVSNLKNKKIFIFKNELRKYKNIKEYYWYEIIGCYVFNKYFFLGKIINLISLKTHDVLIIKSNLLKINKKKILIPFIEPNIITKIDLINKFIKVNWDI